MALICQCITLDGKKRVYSFTDHEGKAQTVCEKFFRHTLGFTGNKIINHLFNTRKWSPGCGWLPKDQRGKHTPKHALPVHVLNALDDHILTYNPTVSHYKRAQCPNRLYISSEHNLTSMYTDFTKTSRYPLVSKETYRRRIKSKNISFTDQGNTTCEECIAFKEGCEHAKNNLVEGCPSCDQYKPHRYLYKLAREEYNKDAALDDPDTYYVSADMQKVMLLPYLHGVKTCIFTSRLVCFHETFAPIGKQDKKKFHRQTKAVVWHEAISGRLGPDVASAFVKAILDMSQSCRHIVVYLDNCSSQNKNWFLFTTMVRILWDHPEIADSVTFKYLETGHTYMSADSFHGHVEKRMEQMKHLHDFNDLVTSIETSGGGPRVLQMAFDDFCEWDKKLTQSKFVDVPALTDIKVVQFKKNSTAMFYKTSHADNEFVECEFLQQKVIKQLKHPQANDPKPLRRSSPRGIKTSKRDGIVTKLGDLLNPNTRSFWESLPINDNSIDLATTYESDTDI